MQKDVVICSWFTTAKTPQRDTKKKAIHQRRKMRQSQKLETLSMAFALYTMAIAIDRH
jgi:hypothetical protein